MGLFGILLALALLMWLVFRGRLGTGRAMLSVVLASAVVTCGGVSVFVAFWVLVPP